jgi:hypothetical protein
MGESSFTEKIDMLVSLLEHDPVGQHGLIHTLAKEIRDGHVSGKSCRIESREQTTVNIFSYPDNYKVMLASYTNFNDYVSSHPEGESFRKWLTRDGHDNIVIFESPVRAFSGPLPDGFYWACIAEMRDKTARVIIQGCDDGMLVNDFDTLVEATLELEEIAFHDFYSFSWFEDRGYEYE